MAEARRIVTQRDLYLCSHPSPFTLFVFLVRSCLILRFYSWQLVSDFEEYFTASKNLGQYLNIIIHLNMPMREESNIASTEENGGAPGKNEDISGGTAVCRHHCGTCIRVPKSKLTCAYLGKL